MTDIYEKRKKILESLHAKKKALKEIDTKIRRNIYDAIISDKLLSGMEWKYSGKCGWPNELTFITVIPAGDEYKVFDLLPKGDEEDDYEKDIEIIKGVLWLTPRKAYHRGEPAVIHLHMAYGGSKDLIKQLGLTVIFPEDRVYEIIEEYRSIEGEYRHKREIIEKLAKGEDDEQ
jgi:hypothetical protein